MKPAVTIQRGEDTLLLFDVNAGILRLQKSGPVVSFQASPVAGENRRYKRRQYERLRETVDAILIKMPQSDNSHCDSPRRKAQLRLVWCKSRAILLQGQAARLLQLSVEHDAP
jgi:hypothetical protein